MIIVKNLTHQYANNAALFRNLQFTLAKGEKVALVGNNGSGKSTLLGLLAGAMQPQEGEILLPTHPYYLPQHVGQYNEQSVAQALGIATKRNALQAILAGEATTENFDLLDDDWAIEERTHSALASWQADYLGLDRTMASLSGGEKTLVFLAGLLIHQPAIVLMDEPTNHLDQRNRNRLYEWVEQTTATLVVVSHDRALLSLLPCIYELEQQSLTRYGGNYTLYREQKELQQNALMNDLESQEKELRLLRKTAQKVAERKEKHDSRGKKQNAQKGIPRIALNSMHDKAERSSSKLKELHTGKVTEVADNIARLRTTLPPLQGMKLQVGTSTLHTGKQLVAAQAIRFGYAGHSLWEEPLTFQIRSGQRLSLSGSNGSGKTTLLRLIAGELEPTEGQITRAPFGYLYIDQEYSLVQTNRTLYQQLQHHNHLHLPEHELKSLLTRYLFPHGTWEKSCNTLSGGERMRLLLCCLTLGNQSPDLFILDEPTNNLDMQSTHILTSAMKAYRGTLLVVSHDPLFLEEIEVTDTLFSPP